MIRRVVVVDSGLRGLGGHNYSYTTMMIEALHQRGFSTRVVGAGAIDDVLRDQGIERGPSVGVGSLPDRTNLVAILKFLSANSKIFAREIEPLLAEDLASPETLVFTHTLTEFEVIAWSQLAPRMRCSLAMLIRQTPVYRNLPAWKRLLHPYFRRQPLATQSLQNSMGTRFCLLADGAALAQDLAYGLKVPCTPVPVPVDPAVLGTLGQEPPGSSRPTLGYLGDARAPKGFHLLAPLIRAVLSERDVRFLIQCPPARGGETDAQREIDRLKSLQAEYGDRLVLIEQRLSRESYRAALNSMDIVLVPYTSPHYLYSTSGVFAETVAAGKATVVPAPSWMSEELKQRGAGVTYQRSEPGGLTAAVLSAIADLETLREKAMSSAMGARAYYNTNVVLDRIFSALGEC